VNLVAIIFVWMKDDKIFYDLVMQLSSEPYGQPAIYLNYPRNQPHLPVCPTPVNRCAVAQVLAKSVAEKGAARLRLEIQPY